MMRSQFMELVDCVMPSLQLEPSNFRSDALRDHTFMMSSIFGPFFIPLSP